MAKQTYKVLGPIGKPGSPEFNEGDTIDLEEKDAERLLNAKAIAGPVEGHKQPSQPAQQPEQNQGDNTQPPEFDPTNVADDELEGLRRPALEEVAKHEGVEKIGDKNMSDLIAAILEIRKG